MLRLPPQRLQRLRNDESGIALVTAMVLALVLGLLVTATFSFTLDTVRRSGEDADFQASLQAAEAGVDDYLYRLNQDSSYWQFSDTNPPPDGNAAFTSFVPVPGPPSASSFTYAVDTSDLASQGLVRLSSTGEVDGRERTIEVDLRRRNFLDYLYFTKYETRDPDAYPSAADRAWARANCERYKWESPPRDPNCVDISFYGDNNLRDRIQGPLHTNDTMRIFGQPIFEAETTSSWDNGQDPTTCAPARYIDGGGTGSPTFNGGTCDPGYQPVLELPPSNNELKVQTNGALGNTGCLFTGPTRIQLQPDGLMRVWSPFTRSGNCMTVNGAPVPLPANGVIFVQNVPTDPADPNFTAGCPFGGGHPHSANLTPGDLNTYGCRDGDVFIWGTLKGELTVAAENNVNVVWHTRLADRNGTDVLGLVGNNYVNVYHPIRCTTSSATCNLDARMHDRNNRSPFFDPVIEAAILSVAHSFTVQEYDEGAPLGTLTVYGAIAQKYRGAVGTFSSRLGRIVTGVEKDYLYDERLRYLSPPHFLDPVESSWRVLTWSED